MTKPLTSQQVGAIQKDGTWRVDRGLYVQVRGENRSWLLRYRLHGKVRWMGLGSLRTFSLTEAKRKAVAAQQLLYDKVDPIDARRAERRKEGIPTFAESTEAYIASHKASWSSPKHGENWLAQLKRHAHPRLGKMKVDAITASDVVKVLEPIWTTLPTTAGKVRGRIERVLDYARVAGHRSGENPAAWRGNLEHRLPALGRIQRVEHRVAVPWRDAPAVYAKLTTVRRTTSLLLRFLILTGVRYAEGAGARWEEVDLEARVWAVPPERAKTRRAHRVPLSEPALAILRALKGERTTGLVFRGTSPGKPPSDVALRKLLRKFAPGADVHGWRSTLRDWAADNGYSREVAEAALAHTLGSKVEVAYLRSDLFEQRVKLMDDWAGWVTLGRSSA